MDLDLLPATLLQQKLEYYLHHPGLLVREDVRKEFEEVILKFPDIISRLSDDNVRDWRKALKDLEDKVDDIMIFILSQSLRSPMLGLSHLQLPFTFRPDHLKKQLMKLRQLGQEILEIKTGGRPPVAPDNACESTQAEEQINSMASLGFRNYGVKPSVYNDVTTLRIEDKIEKKIEDLLLNTEKKFKLIGVIGRKGIGKSSVVRHVYENEKVKKYFDCYAWISNPSSLGPVSILREMLRQFYFGSPPYTAEMMKYHLLSEIDKCLVGKRFLLVVEGVSDLEIWDSVIFPALLFCGLLPPVGQIVFTSSFLHGRIIFTSDSPRRRIFDTYLINRFYVQIPFKALSQEEALDMFYQLVFPNTQPPGTCPPELEKMARGITQQSGGLHFAIRLLAGVLRGKRSPQLWEKCLRQLKELDESYGDDTVLKAILLGYDALALPLKSCFLYFCIFPKGYVIPLKRVIRLWVAEGLVEETSEKTATESSMAYLQELINRELIQPGHLDVKGDLKSCKFDDNVRRVALDHIIGVNERYLVQSTDYGSSRTAGIPSLRLISIQGFRLLRVLDLDLEGSEIKTLPNSLGTLILLVYLRVEGSKLEHVPASALENLIRLRYLGLRRTGIRELPAASLLKLKDLHTLDVRETKLRKLPPCISQLLHLQHIYLCSSFRREVMEMPLGKEKEQRPLQLQTLAGVRATTNLIEELRRWTQLRKLSIGRVAEADSEHFWASIDKMKFLRSLSIKCETNESLVMGSLASSLSIGTLRIGGSVKALDSAIKCFPSLCRLFLWDNNLTYDPLPLLQDLPNLMVLSLTNTFQVEAIRCDSVGFPELKRLSLFQLRNLKSWRINGGMKKLEFLYIGHCPNLKKPLQDLENLHSLQVVMVAGMEGGLNQMMERKGKESNGRFKVRNIPLIKHDFGATEQIPGTKHEVVSDAVDETPDQSFSISRAIDVLETIADVGHETYTKAMSRLMVDSKWREAFIYCPPHRKIVLLNMLD
ncbi:disease resistance protein RPM1-like isoform X2 [Macadamia integrifolia]|uniref:disease resistance protein RPM1-like isoform X2 n=1 Tax=Macadamia integrifolia TaxID=60698 RepID=UPI001C4F1F45|nr:disease resistance protein RPM1-like isoform X2 [Macadamia integrifolia]